MEPRRSNRVIRMHMYDNIMMLMSPRTYVPANCMLLQASYSGTPDHVFTLLTSTPCLLVLFPRFPL
jgi:hypothetical protein